MSPHSTAVVAVKTVTLLLGGLITYVSYSAYRRTGSPALRMLAAGFAIVTTGALLAGVTDLLLQVELATSLLLESSLTAIGFGVIVYSLYAED